MAALSGLFYGINYMATDVDVQFFSHLNGLVLSNNWGDLIRLLDTCLVNGLPLTVINSATIDAQGDITLNLYAEHKALLFQVIELQGFVPASINGKYRIKGTPDSKTLILKAELKGQAITTTGTAKLASLGYEIIFRDPNDVKRVYRAKNPRTEHPFIRIDEAISDGTNSYASKYAKYAMVGLIENMTHIDDYEDPSKLQLPFDPANPAKNWEISGTGTGVVRGWARWYWARSSGLFFETADSYGSTEGAKKFTLCGNRDAFYTLLQYSTGDQYKVLYGCGLYEGATEYSVIPNWFLMAPLTVKDASNTTQGNRFIGALPLTEATNSTFYWYAIHVPQTNSANRLQSTIKAKGIVVDELTGNSNIFSGSQVAALRIPISDENQALRGNLKHIYYAGNNKNELTMSTPILADTSMYVWDVMTVVTLMSIGLGGVYFYLGELE